MAIDHEDLGGYELFPFVFNWKTLPKIKITPERDIIGFTGTSQELIEILSALPHEFTVTVDIHSREDEKTLLDFFDEHKGMWKKFWIKIPVSNYILYETLYADQLTVYFKSTGLYSVYHGYERFYIDDASGNSIIRQMASLSLVEGDPDYLVADLNTAPVETWNMEDTSLNLGRVALVRFDHDDLVINYKTDSVASITLKMIELLYEYGEV